jgi:hypothetical protein
MKLQRWHWAVIVLVTAVLVVMAPSDDRDVAKKNSRPDKTVSNTPASKEPAADRPQSVQGERVELELLSKLEIQHKETIRVNDVFNQTSWYVAPPPPPKSLVITPPPIEVQVPVAPVLPFIYLGRYGDTDTRTVVLSKGEKVYTVTVGEIIENTYRVEKFTKGAVNMTYLPLNIVQSLRTGEAL